MRHTETPDAYDVVIAGGGPAGLEAALILGRARRRVLLCDLGEPRNAPAHTAYGVFTRDGTPPQELLRIARMQLVPYGTVQVASTGVLDAERHGEGFAVTLGQGEAVMARKLLLATGVRDELPPVEGMAALWGKGVFHCPYCHAYELRDRPLAVYGETPEAVELACLLTNWTADITLCTNGPVTLAAESWKRLQASGITVRADRVLNLACPREGLLHVAFDTGEVIGYGGMFLRPVLRQRCAIAERLGARLDSRHLAIVDEGKQTHVPGLYVAGDPSNQVQSVLLAAASGATAAFAINAALTREDVDLRASVPRRVAAPAP